MVRAYLTGEIQTARAVLDQSTMGVEPTDALEQFIAITHAIMSKMAVFIPLLAGDEAMGVLVAIFPRDMLSEEEQGMLLSLADQAGLAIENARLFNRVRSGSEWLRALARRVLTAQEDERRSLSHELHDEFGQALTALKVTLEMLHDDLPGDAHDLRQRVDEAVALTDTTMEGMRLLSHSLRPPALDALGLNPALESYCQEFAGLTNLNIDYIGAELPMLPEEVKITFYRLLQEALTNVAKHAQADQVRVTMGYGGEAVSLAVEDNGCGFHHGTDFSGRAETMGIGILGMRERLQALEGELKIKSKLGKGAKLISRIPIEDLNEQR